MPFSIYITDNLPSSNFVRIISFLICLVYLFHSYTFPLSKYISYVQHVAVSSTFIKIIQSVVPYSRFKNSKTSEN